MSRSGRDAAAARPSALDGPVLALSGGVGGARLVDGLARLLPARQLVVVANTGDDFTHLGLRICPDLDTVMYTLAGLANPDTGWGRRDESWAFMDAMQTLGGPDWFRLGDRDLATHVWRSQRLADGQSLSAVTAELCRALGVRQSLLPMSELPVATRVRCDTEELSFQDYFVRRRCEPQVREVRFQGAEEASPQADFAALLADSSLSAVVICPSNPLLSIGPILALPDIRSALRRCSAPVIGVSPIVGGRALKGPTADMMRSMGMQATAAAVAEMYSEFLDGWVVDQQDRELAAQIEVPVRIAATVMDDAEKRQALAAEVCGFAAELGAASRPDR